jgi:CheY-like chemotaxis protein
VLVVDDNDSQRRLVAHCAAEWDVRLVEAASLDLAESAIANAPGDPFDLILIDADLLGTEPGAGLAQLQTASGGRIPFVLSVRQRPRSGEAGALAAAACVVRPVRPAQLLAAWRQALSAGATAESRAAMAVTESLAATLPLSVLVADDNAVNQMVARMMLKRLGYTADVAANGVEVLQVVEARPYDLILMDVRMPEMDGYEASRRIVETWAGRSTARPRIIAMTGNALQGERERCLEAGMDDYMAKPFRLEELAALLRRWGPKPAAPAN